MIVHHNGIDKMIMIDQLNVCDGKKKRNEKKASTFLRLADCPTSPRVRHFLDAKKKEQVYCTRRLPYPASLTLYLFVSIQDGIRQRNRNRLWYDNSGQC